MDLEITTNLGEFPDEAVAEAIELLVIVMTNGLPRDFIDEGVCLAYNSYSGRVLLTNSASQLLMENSMGDGFELCESEYGELDFE